MLQALPGVAATRPAGRAANRLIAAWRCNCTVRYDWLGQYLFDSIEEVRDFSTR
jgi:hypothetical protein